MNRNYFIREPAGNKEFIISFHWQSALTMKYENAFLTYPKKAYLLSPGYQPTLF
jgi:hypothetical protein